MTVTRVGNAMATVGASGVTTIAAAFSQPPKAGNLLVMGVMGTRTTTPSCSTPAGWTAGPTGTVAGGSVEGIFLFWKVAAGSDPTPSLYVSSTTTTHVVVEEWSGLTSTPHDTDSTVGKNSQNNTAAGICNSGPLTTTNANDWIWSFLGARVNTPARVLTWAGGSVPDSDFYDSAASAAQTSTATQTVTSPGTYNPTLAFGAGGGVWAESMTASMAFNRSADAAQSGFIGWGVPL